MENLLYQMGRRILARRKYLRLTQEELAARADLTAQTISSAELGKKALRPENIVKICTALEISTDYLLSGKEPQKRIVVDQERLAELSDEQMSCLETIINCFLLAVSK